MSLNLFITTELYIFPRLNADGGSIIIQAGSTRVAENQNIRVTENGTDTRISQI